MATVTRSIKRYLAALAVVMSLLGSFVYIGVTAGTAQAATTVHSAASHRTAKSTTKRAAKPPVINRVLYYGRGQCGGVANSIAQLTYNWEQLGILRIVKNQPVPEPSLLKILNTSHYRMVDGNFPNWLSDRAVEVSITKPLKTADYGCNNGSTFVAGPKVLPVGQKLWAALPNGYSKATMSLVKTKVFSVAKTVSSPMIGSATCSNPEQAMPTYIIYVKPPVKKVVKPVKKPIKKPIPVSSAVCILNGVAQSTVPSGFQVQNGQCVAVSVTVNVPVTVVVTPPPPTTTTIPPPSHYTQVSCKGFEEISGGGSMLIQCAVSDDNGAPISLNVSVKENPPNSMVSGINCYSQNGTPSCSGNGTFEFRVDGINSGSSVVYSTIDVVATANGIDSHLFEQTYQVDPSSGGF